LPTKTDDTPGLSTTDPLVPGTVITLEPGLYLSADDTTVPERFRGIGIRIEDNVVVRDDGTVEVLTQAAPKRVAEIEALMAKT
jgi:Xaa-Pro aminopeptidase